MERGETVDCKVSQRAVDKLRDILAGEGDDQLKVRIFVDHVHGDHAHYALGLDYLKETDELVMTDTGFEVLLEKGQPLLDGVSVDYNPATDQWSIVHPSQGAHHGEG